MDVLLCDGRSMVVQTQLCISVQHIDQAHPPCAIIPPPACRLPSCIICGLGTANDKGGLGDLHLVTAQAVAVSLAVCAAAGLHQDMTQRQWRWFVCCFEDTSLTTTRCGSAQVATGQINATAAQGAQLRRNVWFLDNVLFPKDGGPRLTRCPTPGPLCSQRSKYFGD